ncbi:MAG: hypothetical protein DRN15_01055 [Thermoprotei archaeon]|nr:MAG: hypothetical protein DRN15_01055 [Thermoprotei archaeon]RLF25464.1 MAG: hypothetical protein DRM97_01665 [Thermoprotei archaeon]
MRIILIIVATAFIVSLGLTATVLALSMRTINVYTFRSSMTLVNRGSQPFPLDKVAFDRLAIFCNTSWQTVKVEWVKLNGSLVRFWIERDADGNPVIVYELNEKDLAPGARVMVEYQVSIEEVYPKPYPVELIHRSGEINEVPPHLHNYTKGGGLWQVHDRNLRRLAEELKEDRSRVIDIVMSFVTWIDANIRYGTHIPPYYPSEVLKHREGDCDEQAMLLITLCRIVGIPAYLELGAVMLLGKVMVTKVPPRNPCIIIRDHNLGWHAWALVYVPEVGWVPVDMTFYRPFVPGSVYHITGAAIVSKGTLLLGKVSETDYIAECKEFIDVLREHNATLYEENWLDFEGSHRTVRVTSSLILGLVVTASLGVMLSLVILLGRRESSVSRPHT